MIFGWDTLGRLLADGLEDMIWDNIAEVEVDQDQIPTAPDWAHMLKLEEAGGYRVISARDDGRLVGYNSFFINRHTRHMHTVFAIGDVLYMLPEYRRGWAGIAFLRQTDRLLKEAGVIKVQYGIKEHVKLGASRGTVGDLLTHLGYRHIESVYGKVL